MPRKANPIVEQRILAAARTLWIKGGDQALSMRAVAKAAGTNTPAIYRRFRNREELLRALVRSAQQRVFETIQPCRSLQEVGQKIFEFALSHRHEYELLSAGLLAKLKHPQPNLELVKRKAAEWLGGSPEDHTPLVLALWSIVHGAAMLVISKTVPIQHTDDLRSAFPAALEILVSNAPRLRNKNGQALHRQLPRK